VGRLRFDPVALLALLATIATGVVPPDKAFSGFSDDIVIIVASAILVSAAVERVVVLAVSDDKVPFGKATRAARPACAILRV
jgi:di/tricarboxylate transporter